MMKNFYKYCLWLVAMLQLIGCSGDRVDSKFVPFGLPKNINYAENKLEFVNPQTLGSFGKKWAQEDGVINIAHFGDSHIQPGYQIALLRDMFQAIKGDAGRGMIFPYSIAKTYSQEDFSSSFTGKWKTSNSIHQPPKISLGVSGFVGTTRDKQAQIKFNFKKPFLNRVKVKIWAKSDNGDYELSINNGRETKIVRFSQNSEQTIDVEFNSISKNLILTLQTKDDNAEFSLYGISFVNSGRSGVVYHNLGVGGASYNALLQQALFFKQFPLLNADLVILDWGTNDLIYTNRITSNLEKTIRQTIRKIRMVNPKVAILLTSVQEANYKGRNVTVSAQYAQLVKKIAKQEGTLFYDWYKVSGKENSINYWRTLKLASKDGIHLNAKGYRIRAKLLGEAILKSVNQ